MPLETATFVQDLVPANPPGGDDILQGDDHLRLIKTALDNTFPNADKAFFFPNTLLKTANHTILAAEMNVFFDVDATAGAFSMTLPVLGAGDDGWATTLIKIDNSANDVTVVGTINGIANFVMGSQWQVVHVWWNGTEFRTLAPVTATTLLAELTAPAVGDFLPIFDVSATGDMKITLANMLKVVDVLTAKTVPALADTLLIHSAADTAVRKMVPGDLLRIISLLTEDATPDYNLDYVVTNDATDNSSKKVKLAATGGFSGQLLHMQDQKASGVDGGSSTNGSFLTRVLNTVLTNEITNATLVANQFSLPAGTYFVMASAPHVFDNDGFKHQIRIRNITDGTTAVLGTSESHAGNGSGPGLTQQTRSFVNGRFTIAGTKVFELQYRVSNSNAGDGLGIATGFDSEVYSDVMVWKVR